MLTTLVQQQKIWAIPLMVSVALSWCLLFCGQLFAQSQHVVEEAERPACHSSYAQSATTEVLVADELCAGCELDAVQTANLELPPLLLWLEAVTELILNALPLQQHSLYLAQGPPYPRTTSLYLQKSLLLI